MDIHLWFNVGLYICTTIGALVFIVLYWKFDQSWIFSFMVAIDTIGLLIMVLPIAIYLINTIIINVISIINNISQMIVYIHNLI